MSKMEVLLLLQEALAGAELNSKTDRNTAFLSIIDLLYQRFRVMNVLRNKGINRRKG